MNARTQWLSAEERELIVDGALRVLAGTGVRLGACDALDELDEAGVPVDRGAGVVRLPRALVERDAGARRRAASCSPAPRPTTTACSTGTIHFVPSGIAHRRRSTSRPGEYRPSTLEDVRRVDHRRRRHAAWSTSSGRS